MNRNTSELAVLPIACLLIGGFLLSVFMSAPSRVPDFSAITNVDEKKSTFFSFMLPSIRRANDDILKERSRLLDYQQTLTTGHALSQRETKRLAELMKKYRLDGNPGDDDRTAGLIAELLQRVDTIPASLVLAQSANESAWGTARFARQGNNYFGIWCWSRNCGMLPSERAAGATHEVATFDTVTAGVAYYMQTLNSHPAYQPLRDRRAELRTEGKPPNGVELAAGLLNYSERREAYVDEIRAMISYNDLSRFNRTN